MAPSVLRASGRVRLIAAASLWCFAGCLSFPTDGRYACDLESGTDCSAGGLEPGGGPPEDSGSEGDDLKPVPGEGDGGPDAPDAGSVPPGMGGTAMVHYRFRGADELRPRDLSKVTVGAYALDAVTGEYRYYPGTGRSDGTFEVPQVPGGDYLLRADQRYWVTTERTVDLGFDDSGRPPAATVLSSSTTVTFQVTGLSPWSPLDTLSFTALGPGVEVPDVHVMEGMVENAVQTPNKALAAAALGLSNLDPDDQDPAHLVQLESRTTSDGKLTYLAATRHFLWTGLEITPGTNNVLTGTMAPAPGAKLTFDWKRSAYAALAKDVHPTATVVDDLLTIEGKHEPANELFGTRPLLLRATLNPSEPREQLALDYANPFVATAGAQYASIYTYFTKTWTAKRPTGETVTFSERAAAHHQDLVARFAATPQAPVVTPPRSVKINGEPASGDLQGVGTQPTLSWSPPAVGADGTFYVVELKQVSTSGTGPPTVTSIATLTTPRMRLKLPPELLKPGYSYFFELQALRVPGSDLTQRPYGLTLPKSLAPTWSGLFTP